MNAGAAAECFDALSKRAISSSGIDIYGQDKTTVKQAVSLSFDLFGDED